MFFVAFSALLSGRRHPPIRERRHAVRPMFVPRAPRPGPLLDTLLVYAFFVVRSIGEARQAIAPALRVRASVAVAVAVAVGCGFRCTEHGGEDALDELLEDGEARADDA